MSLEPFNKTDSSSCTSESDLESFTVDEVMRELSEFAPYDDSCEPLATEEEAAAGLQRKSSSRRRRRTTVSTKIFRRDASESMVWYYHGIDLYFYFPISTYPLLNRARDNFVAM